MGKLLNVTFSLFLIILCIIAQPSHAQDLTEQAPTVAGEPPTTSVTVSEDCKNSVSGSCHSKAKSLKLKIVAMVTILVTGMTGVTVPLLTQHIDVLQPDSKLFTLVKAFASGVILGTGFMHVLPDSFECLTSECLPKKPWSQFPFTTFIAMLSAIATLMVDSYTMAWHKKHGHTEHMDMELPTHCHGHLSSRLDDPKSHLRRYKVVAKVLEIGIVVHSVVIGVSMGASDNVCTIRPLIAALCFHQFFEGLGLGGCIIQAEFQVKVKTMMVLFFSLTTPFGIALGIGLSNVYHENSPTALMVVGVLNAVSAGVLNCTALVDMLASDFMGKKLQGNLKLHTISYIAVLLGAGSMSLLAIWA